MLNKLVDRRGIEPREQPECKTSPLPHRRSPYINGGSAENRTPTFGMLFED